MTSILNRQSKNWGFSRLLSVEEYEMLMNIRPGLTARGHPWAWAEHKAVAYTTFVLDRHPDTAYMRVHGLLHFESSRKMSWLKKRLGDDAKVWIEPDIDRVIDSVHNSTTTILGPWTYGERPYRYKLDLSGPSLPPWVEPVKSDDNWYKMGKMTNWKC